MTNATRNGIKAVHVISFLFELLFIVRLILELVFAGKEKEGAFAEFVVSITEPILDLFRALPHTVESVDLSPLYVLISIYVLDFIAVHLIKSLARGSKVSKKN